MPRFDSSFLFGNLLDKKKGGVFSITSDSDRFSTKQYYIENTNVLCTEVDTHECKYRVTDCAPRFTQYDRYFKPLMLVRKIEPLKGSPHIKVNCHPTYNYGNSELKMTLGSNHIRFLGLDEQVRITTNVPLNYIIDGEFFVLNDTKYLVFTFGPPLEAPVESTCESFITKTVRYWQHWVKSTSIGGLYQDQMIRSALALKIHQFEDTGAIIASCTASLPESDQSTRNWDYRFCWMRDTYYTLNAFSSIGHFEELEQYFNYILNIVFKQEGRLPPLYGIAGEH
jgi:GH15 family glucan-1,4-alpha-glucosidase